MFLDQRTSLKSQTLPLIQQINMDKNIPEYQKNKTTNMLNKPRIKLMIQDYKGLNDHHPAAAGFPKQKNLISAA